MKRAWTILPLLLMTACGGPTIRANIACSRYDIAYWAGIDTGHWDRDDLVPICPWQTEETCDEELFIDCERALYSAPDWSAFLQTEECRIGVCWSD